MTQHFLMPSVLRQVFLCFAQSITEVSYKYALFNGTHKRYFLTDQFKARTTVGVTVLAESAGVMIDQIARRPQENA